MTIYTIYANTNDHKVEAADVSSWLDARSGTSVDSITDSGTNLTIGATVSGGTYRARQVFLQFDLSAVPADTPNSVELKIKNAGGGSGMTVKAAERAWSGGTGDFVPGADLAALTQFGSHVFLNSSVEYKTFTGLINPSRSATYQLVLYDVGQESATAPTDNLTAQFYHAETAGTSEDPYIVMDVTRKLAAAAAAFTLAGQPVIFGQARASEVGAFTITGIDAVLRHGKVLSAGTCAFTITGIAIALGLRRFPPIGRTITFDASRLDTSRNLEL